MPQRRTNPPANGPTITTVTYTRPDIMAALTEYAEANGGALPSGPKRLIEIREGQVVLEIRTPQTP